jgi:hypothetical protein
VIRDPALAAWLRAYLSLALLDVGTPWRPLLTYPDSQPVAAPASPDAMPVITPSGG